MPASAVGGRRGRAWPGLRPAASARISRAGAVGDDPALADQHDPVGVLVGLLEVVRREQHRAALLGVAPDRGPERAAALDVHAGGRLVEEQQGRVGQQRHREPQPLLLTAGALGHLAVGDAGDPGVARTSSTGLRVGEQAGGVGHRLPDLRSLIRPPVCITADEAAGDGLPRLQAEHAHLAGRGPRQPEHHVDGRGLAGAVRPEEGDDLALLELEVDAAHGLDLAEGLGHPRERDRGHSRGGVGPGELGCCHGSSVLLPGGRALAGASRGRHDKCQVAP